MQKKTKRFLSVLLSVIMVIGMIAVIPMSASAYNFEVVIAESDSDAEIRHKIQSVISNDSSDGDTITVTGTKTNAPPLAIESSGRTIIWKASYTGSSSTALFELVGDGAIEVAEGGSIINLGSGRAIYSASQGASVTVRGGAVSSFSNIAIVLFGDSSSIIVSGGVVASFGLYEVLSIDGAGSTITVNGGFVGGYGTDIVGYINIIYMRNSGVPSIGGSAVVCAWNKNAGNTNYAAGTSNDLTVSPAGATVKWAKNGAQSGISYTNGSNTGFFPISGVTVTAAGATITPTTASFLKGSSADFSITVDLEGFNPQNIKNGAYTLQYGTDYTITGNVVTFKAAYLNSLAVGTHSITLVFDGGVNPVLTVTVTAAGATITPTTVSYTKNSTSDATVTVDLAGYTPQSIRNGSYTLQLNTDYAIIGNTVSIKAAYLNTLAVGTHSLTFVFSGGINPTLTVVVTAAPNAGSMSNFVKTRTYTPGMFADVDENQWYGYNQQKVIANAYEYGLMQGSGNTFNPTGNMTIAEAITVAARVYHIYKGGNGVFTQGSTWYQVYVDYAITNNIIGAGTFSDYNKAATRAEMAYIFSNALPAVEFAAQNTVNALPDVSSSTPYYSAIIMLYKAGVVAGSDTQGTFSPANNITRAEAAAIISRVILPNVRFNGKIFG